VVADAAVVFPAETDGCKDAIFVANFDAPGQVPSLDWADLQNVAPNPDGGPPISSGGTAELIPGGTSGTSALLVKTFGQNRPAGATTLLVKSLPWDGQCLSYRFDVMAPARNSAGGVFLIAVASMFGTNRGVGVVLDTTDPTSAKFVFGATQGRQLDGGGKFVDEEIDLGSVVKTPGQWLRIAITMQRNSLLGYEVSVSLTPSDPAPVATRFNHTMPPQPAGQTGATISLGAFHTYPAFAEVVADSVRVTSGTPSSSANNDQ